MIITKHKHEDAPKYYERYTNLVDENDLIAALRSSAEKAEKFISSLPASKGDYQYAAGKWTVKEVLTHVTDTERVLMYRALRFSRLDPTPLSGFDENIYAPNSNAANRLLEEIKDEFLSVRNASITLYNCMTDTMLDFKGTANNNQASARSIGFFVVGHQLHHMNVITERYL